MEMESEDIKIAATVILAGILSNPNVNPHARIARHEYPVKAVGLARELIEAAADDFDKSSNDKKKKVDSA